MVIVSYRLSFIVYRLSLILSYKFSTCHKSVCFALYATLTCSSLLVYFTINVTTYCVISCTRQRYGDSCILSLSSLQCTARALHFPAVPASSNENVKACGLILFAFGHIQCPQKNKMHFSYFHKIDCSVVTQRVLFQSLVLGAISSHLTRTRRFAVSVTLSHQGH